MVRCQMNFKRLSLTDIKIDIKRVPKKTTLIKAMEEAGNAEAYAVDFFNIVVFYSSSGFEMIVWKRIVALNLLLFFCRREDQVGEQLMGQEADCSEEESSAQ